MRIDILMCTFRRPQVAETIASIGKLRGVDQHELRLVIADNDDTDSARQVVTEAAGLLPIPLVYVHAPARNISIARNACLDAAGDADWVAGLDDDEIVTPDWLAEILDAAVKAGAECAIGKVIADYPADTPHWVRELDYHSSYPELEKVPTANSGNAIIRWKGMPWVNERYDLARGTTGGEDTEFFLRLSRMGMRMVAAPKATLSESVPPNRQTLEWLANRRFRMGQTHIITAPTPVARAKLLVTASAKAAYCRIQERRHADDETKRNFWFLRGQLHRGVVTALTTDRPQAQLYGGDPA
ncbi:glycosyltransferase family 2 protein [Paracoccus shanxieyensis]|uniref:Glycosyltransferase n=1 Tax=Paracoccus shanxieyensis TaxID=2675752 RepID=A0A6L6IVD4_9RHOB|nr:glycosyltransferase family 2 protein [Paracoccus shanxieyensis]MTH64465.1 glycosyltransferase [Paracoccus shanxieyensis]MTH87542.1 glycosyltransferase [Paracoccus shanxieyensis]